MKKIEYQAPKMEVIKYSTANAILAASYNDSTTISGNTEAGDEDPV